MDDESGHFGVRFFCGMPARPFEFEIRGMASESTLDDLMIDPASPRADSEWHQGRVNIGFLTTHRNCCPDPHECRHQIFLD